MNINTRKKQGLIICSVLILLFFSRTIRAQTPLSACPSHPEGDANCDGKIDGLDYSIWLNSQCHPAGGQNCANLNADFNSDKAVDDNDYSIWFANRNTVFPTGISAVSPTPTQVNGNIWTPPLKVSWQWLLGHPLDIKNQKDMGLTDASGNLLTVPAPDVYDIDGFDNDSSTITALHRLGKHVICYLDVGGMEPGRPDAGKFPSSVVGNKEPGWNENFLDIRQINIIGPIEAARMDMCKSKGFDAIEPDVIDAYANNSGFPLTYQDQIAYNKWLAATAHAKGMSILLKGDIAQAKDLEPYFDFVLNEECFAYNECGNLNAFSNDGKSVLEVEYKGNTASFCPTANNNNWNAMLMPLNLDGGRKPCR